MKDNKPVVVLVVVMFVISLLALASNNSFAFSLSSSASNRVAFKAKEESFSNVILNAHGGAAAIQAKGTPDFNTVATTNMGMYAAQDDDGTSYYFRGAVNDNWVYFAGYYWRIIRINGDGSVRMIYSGSTAPTSSQATVMTGTGTQILTSEFNSSSNDNRNVAYFSSSLKNAIELFYPQNIISYAMYLANGSFCNDRKSYTDANGTTSGGGVGTTQTYYAPYVRLVTNKAPILTCPNSANLLSVVGFGNMLTELEYPIATITADEIMMAGGKMSVNNTSYYLYTGQQYWSMSPSYFRTSAYVFTVNASGGLGKATTDTEFGVRPVINVRGELVSSGDGTYNNPYKIVPGVSTLAETILYNHGGRDAIEAKTTPDFTATATTNEGMFYQPDISGSSSYYFRGAVDDNWVYFAGYYWRIIRINGDDSVRMIYSGSVAPTASQSVVMASASTMITGIPYNTLGSDNAYVGYMYTIGNAHGYGTSSNMKGATGGLEAWYAANLSSLSDYISTYTYFCNDRVSYTDSACTTVGGGTGTTTSYYAAYKRLGRATKTPSLLCSNQNDTFLVNNPSVAIGRAVLTYPIGLITADEVAMAGGKAATTNTSYYLYTGSGNEWFTMSPVVFSSNKAYVYRVNSSGGLVTGDVTVSGSYGMRPVIALKGDVLVKGNGTWNNPYTIY